jgi:hypothetical protein
MTEVPDSNSDDTHVVTSYSRLVLSGVEDTPAHSSNSSTAYAGCRPLTSVNGSNIGPKSNCGDVRTRNTRVRTSGIGPTLSPGADALP